MIKLKLIGIACIISISACSAQGKYEDSLRLVLQRTVEPVKRFDILYEFIFNDIQNLGHIVDSASCMQMVNIAQQLKSDSLLAIAYNNLGSYFSYNKGDFATGLEFYFKGIPLAERSRDKRRISSLYFDIAGVYAILENYQEATKNNKKGLENLPDNSSSLYNFMLNQYQRNTIDNFLATDKPDSALYFISLFDETTQALPGVLYTYISNLFKGAAYAMKGDSTIAEIYFRKSVELSPSVKATDSKYDFYKYYIPFLLASNRPSEALIQARQLLELGHNSKNENLKVAGAKYLRLVFDKMNLVDSAYYYARMEAELNEEIFSQTNKNKIQSFAFSEQIRSMEEKNKADSYQNQLRQKTLLFGLAIILIIAFILYRNNKQKQKANNVLLQQKKEIESTLSKLKTTQSQLIQSEKMASLGELTAGIAHEIQNPLNFVNNFSELNIELIRDLKSEIRNNNLDEVSALATDIESNSEKINHHGKRSDAIVKGMLQHSRSSSGQKELTDINALCDEYLRLSYHGLRAKDKSFNAKLETDFDSSLPKLNVVPQDIGRVVLNLINNAFYAVSEKSKVESQKSGTSYEPTVTVSTKNVGDKIEISVKDNGSGIPEHIKEKIFQPFFTTKPTGQGTGLGLSLSYDIVKAHGGEVTVVSKDGAGSEFIIKLPFLKLIE